MRTKVSALLAAIQVAERLYIIIIIHLLLWAEVRLRFLRIYIDARPRKNLGTPIVFVIFCTASVTRVRPCDRFKFLLCVRVCLLRETYKNGISKGG